MSANGKNLAFPLDAGTKRHFGLTKRELISAMAMQGLLSDTTTMANISRDSRERGVDSRAYIACACVEFADALLAELAKDPQA